MNGQAFQFPVFCFNGGFPLMSTDPSSAYSFTSSWKIKKSDMDLLQRLMKRSQILHRPMRLNL